MTHKFLILLAGTALSLTACGRNDTDNELSTDVNLTTENDAALGSPADAAMLTAQGFVNAAGASDKFEIESSKLAATAAQSAAVKSYAEKMISAHTESTAKLKSTVAAMTPPVTIDDTLTAEQQRTLDSLAALKGPKFDSNYAAAQVNAHQKTLDALNAYAASGDNPQLKTFATGLIPTVTAHLNMAKGLK